MVKSAGRKSNQAAATVANRSAKVPTDGSANVTEHDIVRCAYDLYEQRGGEHGHDVDDWLQTERELRASSTTRDVSEGHHEND